MQIINWSYFGTDILYNNNLHNNFHNHKFKLNNSHYQYKIAENNHKLIVIPIIIIKLVINKENVKITIN